MDTYRQQKKAKQGKHCIDVWHMWRLAFSPLPCPLFHDAVCLSSEKCRAVFVLYFPARSTFPSIDSFIQPPIHALSQCLIHSFTHSLVAFISFSLGFSSALALAFPFGLFLARFLFHFHFHFMTFAGTFGSFIKFSKSHLALSRLCVLFPSMYSLTIPIPPGIRRHQHRKRLFWGCAVMGLTSSSSSALRVHFNKKKE